MPRGFQGITAIFELYLAAINQRLASTLGFNPKTSLVRQAVEAVANAMTESGRRWLTLVEADAVVNTLLPGRDFDKSLYQGLVVEGVLVEEATRHSTSADEEVVFLSYERFADHLTAKCLLDKHLDLADPAAAFSTGRPLAFLCEENSYVAPGLLEAMCVQVAERTGRELIFLAPGIVKCLGIGDAFRQSIVWRALSSFSDETHAALNEVHRNDRDLDGTLDVLLTVATMPGHRFNVMYLDKRLRKNTMPERDAWWSIYLHHAWGSHGAVDRLVDWAWSISPRSDVDNESVDLCAIALSWMLTTPNRFLRDRATKALVSLLTGRLSAVIRVVDRFAEVNDPYVLERVYAVAYGTAMRCNDEVSVGALAECVYGRIFASGAPPAHLLLRDYARGVIEYALSPGSKLELDVQRIRPPYGTPWPVIPSEQDIKPLLPDESRGDYDSRDLEWARNRASRSVMDDDFAHYVIGTNSSSTSRDWLSVRLSEPAWKPAARRETLLADLVVDFSDSERQAWNSFSVAEQGHERASSAFITTWFDERVKTESSVEDALPDFDEMAREIAKVTPPEVAALAQKLEDAAASLDGALTEEHARRLAEIRTMNDGERDSRRPPGFELAQIQRYILWRVFDLGWTKDRFGYFDRISVHDNGRAASKAERIGKKYQWIAYHEIMAMVADNFQYLKDFREEEGAQPYDGPWQSSRITVVLQGYARLRSSTCVKGGPLTAP